MMEEFTKVTKEELVKDTAKNPKSTKSTLYTLLSKFGFPIKVLAAIAIVHVLYLAQAVFIPLMLGLVVTYVLSAPVNLLKKWHIPRGIGAAVLLTAIVGVTGYGIYVLRGDAIKLIETLPESAQKFRSSMQEQKGTSQSTMENMQEAATQLEQAADETGGPAPAVPKGVTRVQVEKPQFNLKEYLWMGTKSAIALGGQLTIVLFLAYFGLVSGDTYRRKIVRITGATLSSKKITIEVLDEIAKQTQRYLLVQVIDSILVGVVTWLVFLWIGLEHAAIWGIAAGLLNTIPYLGPIVISGGTAIVALLQFGTIGMAIFVGSMALIITSLEGFLLMPWLTGRANRMNPLAVFIAVLFWGWLWGVWGLLLGVPIIIIIKAICDRVDGFRPVADLLGE